MRDLIYLRALVLVCVAGLAPQSRAAHAYAQFGDIKYPAGFTHFDYVNPAAPKGGEIRMVPPTRPTNFDKFNPFTLRGTAPYGLGILLIESLLTGNSEEPTTAYGLLADDVAVAPDKLSVTFRLNGKARFHNGAPVLAADVLHSFTQLTSKLAAPQYRTIYAQVKGVTVVSDRVVRFDFLTPNPELPLVVGGMPVFSRDWGKVDGQAKPFDKIVSDIPIGSGPYKIANPAMGRDITYVRDPAYWGADLPSRKGQFNFDRISFKIYLDETSRFEGLKAGEFDFLREFISRNWARQYTGKAFTSGELVKRAFENRNPGDFQGYVFNLRNPKFQDVRVRRAIGLAMDFEWMNRQMFYGLYKRVNGYFPNSEFHAEGLPKPDELALLEPLRAQLKPGVFGLVPVSPTTTPPGSLRENLRQAQALLREAGWTYRDGALRNAQGEAFTMEFLNDQPSLVRIVGPFQKALEKLGITMTYRIVDFSLGKQKMDAFDFEISTLRLPGSTAPGGELLELFGSKAASTPGSSNVWGIADPAVDALLQKVVTASTRPELGAAMRALDRVLTHGYYSVPQYYGDAFLIGYRPQRFVLPDSVPPYYQPDTWAMSAWWASPSNK
ncbi:MULTISPECIES: extracellular solute-binding protein [unclassified Polaromonas]|uniref:extracellular solute-binding protein n=1 Tax=unclassified Polaromonas TaxID=2638319 RepID=UPI0018C8F3F0|nr:MULTISPECIES: extracellular solute-binding protein [unclassified Polaromonas]MBG6073617.1 microcin C transport system substrate-binding protein [Polaromonas sp. CG_9.7]MBG6115604.1 microcin C transport system substrate-binding protein [Polaromonas sp. CG_9.2]MDH6185057.1 microcin C transport system substrate-binding protein [Polaromonas sp. CG_23.6]